MLLTIANKNAAITQVEGPAADGVTPFPDAIRKRIVNSTVRLNGVPLHGVDFNGSGVIFDVDSSYVYVLTAAHNVQIWAKPEDPATDWETYATKFGEAIKIGYGKDADMTFNQKVPIYSDKSKNTVGPPPLQNECENEQNCLYDVLVIRSSDAGLRTYAKKFVFGDQSFDAIAAQVQQEYRAIGAAPDSFLKRESYYFVHLGYGKNSNKRQRVTTKKIRENNRDKTVIVLGAEIDKGCEEGTGIQDNYLQYRLASPSYTESKTMYNQTAEQDGEAPAFEAFPNSIVTPGPPSSSTAPGDSGGPLYAVDKNFGAAYLLGVTTGADMNPAKTVVGKVFRNVIIASVAPYFKSEY